MILSLMVGVSLNAIGTHTEPSYNIAEDTVSAGEFIVESSINSQEVFFGWNNLLINSLFARCAISIAILFNLMGNIFRKSPSRSIPPPSGPATVP